MTIDVTRSLDELLEVFPESTREKIREAEKKLTVNVFDFAQENHNEILVLLYAFYKDDAYMRRLTIPTYKEVHEEFHKVRKESTVLLAYLDRIPVAALWIQDDRDSLLLRYSGAVTLGYEHQADYFLFSEALKLGKKKSVRQIDFTPEKLFHGMMV